ncbi:MAG: DUF1016 N-terminal domain-containing protein [Fibromonadales bacterium]|nr:DUF1016 N-terminal domain-containing protein [Fibromonadales bacterium]
MAKIIEKRKYKAMVNANCEVVIMHWEIGRYINSFVLDLKRAEYGRQIIATLSQQLAKKYGNSFELTNLRRMMRFAENFTDGKIVATLSPQLSWSHFKAFGCRGIEGWQI